ncbi:MAG: peptidylprolyl isomerase [Brevinema sp.]
MNKKILVILLALGVTMTNCNKGQAKSENTNLNEKTKGGIIRPINPNNPVVIIETELGTIKGELFADKAPITTSNFIKLVTESFYDNIIFHRIIENFMIQTGDPTGTGMGGPGYTIKDEFDPELRHVGAGVFSMANAGPNTGGSQFFITLVPTAWLDNKHAVFGQVIEGLDIVQKIGSLKTDAQDKPIERISMKKVYMQ